MSVPCPRCGQPASLVGLSNQNYPAAFRCYCSGEVNFGAASPHLTPKDLAEVDRMERESAGRSRANAADLAAADKEREDMSAFDDWIEKHGREWLLTDGQYVSLARAAFIAGMRHAAGLAEIHCDGETANPCVCEDIRAAADKEEGT